MAVFDCFLYFNEEELLLTRLHELDRVVDRFIAIEGELTFSGKGKPLYLARAISDPRFDRFRSKVEIVAISAPAYPATDSPWEREYFSRNVIVPTLQAICAKDADCIIVSDCDEIPRATAVEKWCSTPGVKILGGPLYCYYLNCISSIRDYYCRMAPFRLVKEIGSGEAFRRFPVGVMVEDGCWSFSWMGGPERFLTKLSATAHQEYNIPYFNDKDKLVADTLRLKDPLGRDYIRYEIVKFDERFPAYMRENRHLFSGWII